MAIAQFSALNGRRTTASDALLHDPPANLTIMTNSAVDRIVFDSSSQKAIGVESSGKQCPVSTRAFCQAIKVANQGIVYASKEVILCAGALDSPKLLLLSGIGPRDELSRHNIELVHDLPRVGKKLRDRLWIELVTVQKPGSAHRSSYIDGPIALEEARIQYLKDKSGPLSGLELPQIIAYLKSERLLHSKDFSDLDETTQRMLQAETRPHYELLSVSTSFYLDADA